MRTSSGEISKTGADAATAAATAAATEEAAAADCAALFAALLAAGSLPQPANEPKVTVKRKAAKA
jgi:hypothetical protein